MDDKALFNRQHASDAAGLAKSRLRLGRLFFLLVATSLVVPVWNFTIDPYEVFGTKLLRSSGDYNERYAKLEWLFAQKRRGEVHDALVAGASTAGVFRIDELNAHFPGRSFYNAAMLGASLWEIETFLRFHHESINPLKQVVLTVDLFQFVETPTHGGFKMPHPAISGQSWAAFWWGELWSSSFSSGAVKIAASFRALPLMSINLRTGEYRYSIPAERTEKLVAQAWERRATTGEQRLRADAMEQLAQIVRWCRAHNIKLGLLPSPRADGRDTAMVSPLLRDKEIAPLLILPPAVSKTDFYDATHFTAQYSTLWLDRVNTHRY